MNVEKQVYTVQDIMTIMGFSKNTAYEFIKNAPFPVIKIKKNYRISKEVFDRWLNQTTPPVSDELQTSKEGMQ